MGEALFAERGGQKSPDAMRWLERIRQSFQNLPFGQVIITLRDGEVRQVARLTRSRFTGLDGEGI